MARFQSLSVAIATLVLTGITATAHAETAKASPPISFTTREAFTPDQNQWNLQGPRRSMQWDASKGRFGLKFDLEQPALRDSTQKDILQAGAYYKLTPSLRVGGAVALGDPKNLAAEQQPTIQQAPRVRLETTFKF